MLARWEYSPSRIIGRNEFMEQYTEFERRQP